MGVGPWQGPWPTTRSTTVRRGAARRRATGATSWTATATGGTTRSSPTSTPGGTTSTSPSRTGGTTSTSARSSAPPTRSTPRRSTSSAAGAGTGAARWSPTATSTSTTTRRCADLVAWAARHDGGLPLVGIDNLPGSVPLETYDLPRRCVLLFGQEGPGLSDADAREACDGRARIAQFGSTRSINAGAAAAIAMHAWVRRHAVRPGPGAADPPRGGGPAPIRGSAREVAARRLQSGSAHAGPPRRSAAQEAMPIATPEVYAEMLDRAKAGSFAYPAINVSSSQTLNAAIRGLRRGRQRRHRPGLHRRRGVPLRPDRQEHGAAARWRWRRIAHEVAKNYAVQHRAAHRPLPQGQARRLRPAAARGVHRAGARPAARRCSSRTCGTARRCRWRRTSRSPRSCSDLARRRDVILEIEVGVVGGEEDGVEGGVGEQALLHPRGRAAPPSRRWAWARTAAT